MTGNVVGSAIDLILTRHSVRGGFDARPVPTGALELIVRCALAAPSSKNAQPWRFHVVRDQKALEAIADAVRDAEDASTYVPHDPRTGAPYPQYVSTVVESAGALAEVSAAIFVENRGVFSGGRTTLARATPEALNGSLTGYGLELVGLGAAVENMWLAAHALGLAAAFMGDVVVAENAIQQRLSFTGDLIGVLALGYVGTDPNMPPVPKAEGLVVWH
ncbi:nitroreductase family protein [Mycobacterium kubicae]|uniref:nitroreductase family protein n=1 Tax=Mycobacterium kubicae TaxID=120959 RepID=UPI000A23737B|nr:nitroreductase family protein [Mycobacterium kubicae]ORV96502.1 nitroreductase [Mycobacterium kubicae]